MNQNSKSRIATSRLIRKSSRKKPKLKPPKLALQSTANPNNRSKVAEVTLAMREPKSANSNTSSARTVAKQVNALNKHYGKKYNFVIGHLVNEQLGCTSGDANFVPLTSKANAAHKTKIETPLVNFLRKMSGSSGNSFNRAVDDANQLFFAVRYRVESSTERWDKKTPDCYVPKSIKWEITFDVVNKNGVSVTPSGSIAKEFKAFKKEAKAHFKSLGGTIKNEQ